MMFKLLSFILICLLYLFPQFYHPLLLVFILLFMAFTLALLLGVTLPSFWTSYILFLVYLGGLLVLFAYIVTLIPNEPMPGSLLPVSWVLLCYPLLPSFPLFQDSSFTWYLDTLSSLKSLFYPSLAPLTMILILFLLFTLVVAAHITSFNRGPLRTT